MITTNSSHAAVALASAILLALVGAGCEPSRPAKADEPTVKGPLAATKVEVVRPSRHPIRRITEQPGQIEPSEATPIYAKLSGYARTVGVDIGDRVKKGQVLAELWAPEEEANLLHKRGLIAESESKHAQAGAMVEVAKASVVNAEAKVAEVRAGIAKTNADVKLRQAEFDRIRQLVGERAVTDSLLDESRNRLSAAEASREVVGAEVKTAEAALGRDRALSKKALADVAAASSSIEVARADSRRAEVLLGYAKVVAPFDGTITRRNIDIGHLTSVGPQGAPLFIVARVDTVTVAVSVPELYAASAKPGCRAIVRLQALGNRTVEAKVTRAARVLDPSSRTLRVEIDLPNPDGTLLPGLYAYTTVVVEERPDALTVPLTAVVREGDKASCVVVERGQAVRLPIVVGLSDGVRCEVVSGLSGRELVVKVNAASLKAGQALDPFEPPSEPTATLKP